MSDGGQGLTEVRLWLDDMRPAPPGWLWARSVNEAVELCAEHTITHMSLDHDLGYFASEGGDGSRFTDWLAEHDKWPERGFRVHSSNPVGVRSMLATADRYADLASFGAGSSTRGTPPAGGWPEALMVRRD
jgi:hypothetical protein